MSFDLTAEQLAKLLDFAHRYNTTINGIICAAQLFAVKDLEGADENAKFCLVNAVDGRENLLKRLSHEHVILGACGEVTFHKIKNFTADTFWNLARTITESARDYVMSKMQFSRVQSYDNTPVMDLYNQLGNVSNQLLFQGQYC